jgi:hypothetical protein
MTPVLPATLARVARTALPLLLVAACARATRPVAPATLAPDADSVAARERAAWRPANARLLTRWAADVRPDAVLPEYPRPQLVRDRWVNLNGLWEFDFVADSSVAPRPGVALGRRILVPFAPEAPLSGIGEHRPAMHYRRTFTRPATMRAGERLLLHFGAVDWSTTVLVNGREVCRHVGGYDAFSCDITDALRADSAVQELLVAVADPTDAFGQPRGKQVRQPEGIWYTPVSGIWQTVWLEPVPATRIATLRFTPDVPGRALRLRVDATGGGATRVEVVALAEGRAIAQVSGEPGRELRLPIADARLWSPDDPHLYDLRVRLRPASDTGAPLDSVRSYFAMRQVGVVRDSNGLARLALNGRPLFQFGPLDQGWWPDGLYTAPTDAALRWDVERIKALGWNMVRKHIKVEPARWYRFADSIGLVVWQDMPSGWNDTPAARQHFERELRAMLAQLHNVPSIVTWVPFNEKWGQFDVPRIVDVVRSLDSSRTINDVSGWQHEDAGDIIDVHRYQGPQAMRGTAERAAVVGEYGGLGRKVDGHAWAGDAWGYGGLYPSDSALQARYDLLAKRMWHYRDTHAMSAGVYTQLTDVEVELNGMVTYDRAVAKFDEARTAAVNRGLAPYLLPELAEFTDSVRVTVHQGAPTALRYTTDGSEPVATSAVWPGALVLRATTTLRVRGFADGRATAAPEARTTYARVPGRAPLAAASARRLVPGIDYAYYRDTSPEPVFRMHWPVRQQLERVEVRPGDIAPTRTGTLDAPSLAPADTTELFGFRYTGYLRVPRTGSYRITALADDGAAVWIGDREVLWSVGQSPRTTETWGDVALQAGVHPFTATYFQAYGPRGLELFIEGPGMARRRIDRSLLLRDGTPRPMRKETR